VKGLYEFSSVPQRRFRRQLGNELKHFFEEVEATPTSLARRSKKSREYCNRIMLGFFVPSWQTLVDLIDSYGYEVKIRITKKRKQ